ncbi:MAG: SDR family NAD(P)-dependent oxidoreductase [Nocardia sp.]|nr:SDR family NAD(P)-dependent oxidoreductase [Nocardia sp.]
MVAVAIVGIGCHYPGGIVDPSSFWDFVIRKGDAVTEIPAERWDVERYYDPDPDASGRMYTRHASFVDEPIGRFDPDFFGISRREAMILDPQQRRLLQVSWEAMDDAGIAGRVSGKSVGTFIGGFTNDNAVGKASTHKLDKIDNFAAFSSSQTLLSNRLSHALDLRGPSMTVDTACSSSLVTTHLAVRALVEGECEVALVGGSNVIFQPETFITMCKGRFLAVDGRCKSFDAAADGYGRGEGVGIVVLKTLDQALRDRDRIYAVIKGSGVNQDGRTIAVPVPNPDSQYDLARRVCEQAEVDPAGIGFVEAHGTGTGVGDPLEASALGRAYGTAEGRVRALRIGSVKNNFGHTEAAAGVAGLIKAALTVREGRVAPQAYLENPNPEIKFDDWGLHVPLEAEELHGIHAAVNSFGYGGTNAHVVVERAPDPVPAEPVRDSVRVFPVSARNEDSMRKLARSYGDLLKSSSAVADHADTSVDAAAGGGTVDAREVKAAVVHRRAHHHLRKGFVYQDTDDLLAQLESFASGEGQLGDRVLVEGLHVPVFVFSGMGPQWWAMGRDLLNRPGRFRDTAHAIDAEFQEIAGWSILAEVLADEENSKISRTEIAQPANFLIQVALTDLLAGWGVRPAAVVGHSVGEVSAAYVSGALSLTDALTVAYHRSRLQARTAGSGGMLAVGLSAEDAEKRCARFGDAVSVAAVNGATGVTLAGTEGPLEELREELTADGVFARRLRVEVPYHSHLMDPILADLEAALAGLTPNQARVPLYSTVTAARLDGPEISEPGYWRRNVRETVRFADAIDTLIEERYRVFLEVGPHPAVTGNIREAFVRHSVTAAAISTLNRDKGAEVAMFDALAELYQVGAVDTPGEAEVYRDGAVPHMDLPPYPWQELEVWEEDPRTLSVRYGDANRYALLGDRTDALGSEWEVTLAPANLPWLRDHMVTGAVVVPGAAYIDAALAAARQRSNNDQGGVDALGFITPLVVAEHDVPIMRVSVEGAAKRFEVKARPGGTEVWARHAWGRLVEAKTGSNSIDVPADSDEDIRFEHDEIYRAMSALGLDYGPAFQRIGSARVSDGEVCVAELRTADLAEGGYCPNAPHVVHPALIDAALQCTAVLLAASSQMHGTRPVAHIPAGVERVRYYGPVPDDLLAVVRIATSDPMRVDAFLTDRDGTVALAMYGVEFAAIGANPDPVDELEPVFFERRWDVLDPLSSDNQHKAINVVAEIGAAPESVIAGATNGALEPERICWNHDPDDKEQAAAAIQKFAEILARDGYLRVALALGAGYDAADLCYRVVSCARGISSASEERLEADPAGFDVKVVVLTTNGIVGPGDSALDPAHSAVIGLRRTLSNELHPMGWTAIDTDHTVPADVLAAELANGATVLSDEVRLRGQERSAEKVLRSCEELTEPWNEPYRLESVDDPYEVVLPRTRLLKDLKLRACERVDPGPREIEVRIDTIGLNYKDALKVTGILTDRHLDGTYFGMVPGMEAAGVVTRIGSQVTDVSVGDVIAVASRNMLRRYAIVDIDGGGAFVRSTKEHVEQETGEEFDPLTIGSGLPYLTAFYAFRVLTTIQPGESVLIHGAAGGMGMAAVQVAASMGATVFATAGTEERRAAVKDMGAHHVLDSRSSSFVEDVLRLTDGEGVDVVYNSLPGEVISQDFTVAAEFGRIIEIGKADIFFGGAVDLRPFSRNLTFHSIDMDRLLARKPARFREYMQESLDVVSEGKNVKPLPYERFPITELPKAFETVMRGSQIGRVVLDLRSDIPEVLPQRPSGLVVRDDATYLITGGFGAFGLATARALLQRGARRLVLVGRRGLTSEDVRRQVEFMSTAHGIEILCEAADVSNPDSVGQLLDSIADPQRPLRGIFHTAGVINDQPVGEITADAMREVFAPKLGGALALDAATRERGLELDAFVMYSSITGITGTVPQATYAAANASLDAFAAHRRAEGLAATSVNWGAMAGGGMADSSEAIGKYVEMLGFKTIDMDHGAGLLFEASRLGLTNLMLADVDWSTWRTATRVSAGSARFEEVVDEVPESSAAAAARAELLKIPPEERAGKVVEVVVAQLSEVLGVEPESIDTRGPIADLGIDSVMAVEFGARLQKQFDIQVSMFQFTGDLTIEAIAARVVKLLEQEQDKQG